MKSTEQKRKEANERASERAKLSNEQKLYQAYQRGGKKEIARLEGKVGAKLAATIKEEAGEELRK